MAAILKSNMATIVRYWKWYIWIPWPWKHTLCHLNHGNTWPRSWDMSENLYFMAAILKSMKYFMTYMDSLTMKTYICHLNRGNTWPRSWDMSENLYFMAAILKIQYGGFPQVGSAGTFFWFILRPNLVQINWETLVSNFFTDEVKKGVTNSYETVNITNKEKGKFLSTVCKKKNPRYLISPFTVPTAHDHVKGLKHTKKIIFLYFALLLNVYKNPMFGELKWVRAWRALIPYSSNIRFCACNFSRCMLWPST